MEPFHEEARFYKGKPMRKCHARRKHCSLFLEPGMQELSPKRNLAENLAVAVHGFASVAKKAKPVPRGEEWHIVQGRRWRF